MSKRHPITMDDIPEEYRRLSVEQLSRLLSEHGEPIPVEMIRDDITSGCPVNPDGTISLVVYGAWVMRERRGGTHT